MTEAFPRYGLMKQLYGAEQYEKIIQSKILVVGAGGIGCEILKNLALLGIRNIELIDLDTIDVSNLNRQFLFRPEHVGQSKAEVAAIAAKVFNPDVNVKAYHDNVKSNRFSVHYIASFDVVLNALDNIDARRHVNRLCLAAGVPLFDSGTTGYLGQVTPILKGYTSCYECFPKPAPKVYPICTIRSTPDKPVHCIVWAKECLKLIFGNTSESMLFEDESTGEKSEYMNLLAFPSNAQENDEILLSYVQQLIIGLFHKEVQKRIDMETYKTATRTPIPLDMTTIQTACDQVKQILEAKKTNTNSTMMEPSEKKGWDHQVWSIIDSLIEFILSFFTLFHSKDLGLLGQLSFDKDDLWSMKFVTATSNIRSFIFNIPLLSFHDAKGIAGNIIPAIATTNAIVASIQVQQMIKFILHFHKSELFPQSSSSSSSSSSSLLSPSQEMKEKLFQLFPQVYCLRYPNRKGFYLQPSTSDGPQDTCYVCSKSQVTLQIDTNETSLDDLLKKILKGKLGFNSPTIAIGHDIIYEEGDDCDEELQDNLPKLLISCPAGGIHDGTILTITDFTQDLETDLVIHHVSNEEFSKNEATAADLFILNGKPLASAVVKEAEQPVMTTMATAGGDQDVMILDQDVEVVEEGVEKTTGKKRGREESEATELAEGADGNALKKAK